MDIIKSNLVLLLLLITVFQTLADNSSTTRTEWQTPSSGTTSTVETIEPGQSISTDSTTTDASTVSTVTTTDDNSTSTNASTEISTGSEATPTGVPSFDGAFYYFFITDTTNTFDDAQEKCTQKDSNLVSINSTEENNFVVTLITSMGYSGTAWIGLYRKGLNATDFAWVDESSVGYTNWANGYPTRNNTAECEAAIINSHNATWKTVTCDTGQLAYICKQYIGSSVSPTATTSEVTTDDGHHNNGGNPHGLSEGAVIAISIALIFVVFAIIIGGIFCCIKRRKTNRLDSFKLLDNDDFVNANAVTIDDSY